MAGTFDNPGIEVLGSHQAARPTGLPADFEVLRWFPLPPACLRNPRAE